MQGNATREELRQESASRLRARALFRFSQEKSFAPHKVGSPAVYAGPEDFNDVLQFMEGNQCNALVFVPDRIIPYVLPNMNSDFQRAVVVKDEGVAQELAKELHARRPDLDTARWFVLRKSTEPARRLQF